MKKYFFSIIVLILSAQFVSAQAPKAFKYQAAIRDSLGIPVSNQLVSLEISILKGDIAGDIVYTEIHDVTTNTLGLVSLEIGKGLVVTGDFQSILWGKDSYFVQTSIDLTGGMNYSLLGTSQLLAVPYALYAETSGNSLWKESESGIYYKDGNVGIGTDATNWRLTVEDSLTNFFVREKYSNQTQTFTSQIGIGNTSNGSVGIYLDASDGDFQGLDYGSLKQFNDLSLELSNRAERPILFGVGDVSGPNHYKMCIMPSGNVGIGTSRPDAMLEIKAPAIDGQTDGYEFLFKGQVSDAPEDFIKIQNGTLFDNQFIPYIWGHHESDNRQAFGLVGSITEEKDYGDIGVIVFNARTYAGGLNYGYIQNRPLFVWRNLDVPKMTMSAEGNLGIGTTTPQRTLHIKDVMRLEPRFTAPDNPSEGDIYMDGNDHILKVFNGIEWKSCW